ncbi:DDE-domain-containing protein [Fistulina hepatica ATCC 64428]|uniref:DDE-domain-containing protein n=1 Tax=Fistulina hepatica ATCC 64428 TaxID=1128425 RepID=A0A0D7AED2_9AGAR|nr:DDE-domain-containing protein [Fistulina hepatica ATCC 64428]
MPELEKKRAPREPKNPRPSKRPRNPAPPKDAPRTSAQTIVDEKRQNLTLNDWLTVLAFVDKHKDMTQAEIVAHYGSLREGRLIFTQGTLSRKLAQRAHLEKRVDLHPTALSMKRERVVTRPDVERALVLWVQHMENDRLETVTGQMLAQKRRHFEDLFEVPENERLVGEGWIGSFKKTYNLKERRRHGEAASVDLEAVEAERARMKIILATYAPRDRFNADETSLFPMAPPDRGLCSKQMSGKKLNKFRLTLLFAVNEDGSEKLPPFFIGYSRQPRCFNKKLPESLGFYYRNNKKAWMTKVFFQEWIVRLDNDMRQQNRYICVTIDNFTGHDIDYTPTNINLQFFRPNLTSYVQPCDAGIIRTFKAKYRAKFCKRAVQLDEAGEEDIYKINLLEAMMMAREAWDEVTPETIANCWHHTGILPSR